MATKPSGARSSSNSATTTPIKPSGADGERPGASLLKLCNWTIRIVAMMNSITGTTAAIGPCALALSSTAPPVAML